MSTYGVVLTWLSNLEKITCLRGTYWRINGRKKKIRIKRKEEKKISWWKLRSSFRRYSFKRVDCYSRIRNLWKNICQFPSKWITN